MRAAAIDVGSNTCLLTVGEYVGDGRIRILHDELAFTRLGTGVDRTRRLDPACRSAALKTLAHFAEAARELGADTVRAAGTSALRDAQDAGAFIEEVAETTGIHIEVIAGAREAELSFAAVTRTLPPGPLRLVVDIGGNSTELIRGRDAIVHAQSLDVGARRMTERFVTGDPPTAQALDALDAFLDEALTALPDDPAPEEIVAVAGTATTLAAVHLELSAYDAEAVHGTVLTDVELDAMLAKFVRVPLEERIRIPGLPRARAEVIAAGERILAAVLRRFDHTSVRIADRGIRHALLIEALDIPADIPVSLQGNSSGG